MSKRDRVEDGKADLIHDFLASAHVFAAAVADEVEETLLRRTGGREESVDLDSFLFCLR